MLPDTDRFLLTRAIRGELGTDITGIPSWEAGIVRLFGGGELLGQYTQSLKDRLRAIEQQATEAYNHGIAVVLPSIDTPRVGVAVHDTTLAIVRGMYSTQPDIDYQLSRLSFASYEARLQGRTGFDIDEKWRVEFGVDVIKRRTGWSRVEASLIPRDLAHKTSSVIKDNIDLRLFNEAADRFLDSLGPTVLEQELLERQKEDYLLRAYEVERPNELQGDPRLADVVIGSGDWVLREDGDIDDLLREEFTPMPFDIHSVFQRMGQSNEDTQYLLVLDSEMDPWVIIAKKSRVLARERFIRSMKEPIERYIDLRLKGVDEDGAPTDYAENDGEIDLSPFEIAGYVADHTDGVSLSDYNEAVYDLWIAAATALAERTPQPVSEVIQGWIRSRMGESIEFAVEGQRQFLRNARGQITWILGFNETHDEPSVIFKPNG